MKTLVKKKAAPRPIFAPVLDRETLLASLRAPVPCSVDATAFWLDHFKTSHQISMAHKRWREEAA